MQQTRRSECQRIAVILFFSKRCNSLMDKRKVHGSRMELEKIGHKS